MTFDLEDEDYLYLAILENRGQVNMSNDDEILSHLAHSLTNDEGIRAAASEFNAHCDHAGCSVCLLRGAIEVINEIGMDLDHDSAQGLGADLAGSDVCGIQSAVLFLAVVTDGWVHSVMEDEDSEDEEQ